LVELESSHRISFEIRLFRLVQQPVRFLKRTLSNPVLPILNVLRIHANIVRVSIDFFKRLSAVELFFAELFAEASFFLLEYFQF